MIWRKMVGSLLIVILAAGAYPPAPAAASAAHAAPLWGARAAAQEDADRLLEDGMALARQGTIQPAVDRFQQALAAYRRAGNRAGEARAQGAIGGSYLALRQPERARESYEQALAIFRELGDRAGEGESLGGMGAVSLNVDRRRALEYYEQALAIQRELGDRSGQGNTLLHAGAVYYTLARDQRAVEPLGGALERGFLEQALEHFQQALAILREVGDLTAAASALHNIGGVYGALAQYQRAVESLEEALALRREVGDRPNEAGTLRALGLTYDGWGDRERALERYEEAIAAYERLRADFSAEEFRVRFAENLLSLQEQVARLRR